MSGVRADEQLGRSIAALDDDGPVPEPLDHCFEQPPLDRIVVDDKHHFRHYTPHARLCRIGAMSPVCLNGLLSGTVACGVRLCCLKTYALPSPRHEPCLDEPGLSVFSQKRLPSMAKASARKAMNKPAKLGDLP